MGRHHRRAKTVLGSLFTVALLAVSACSAGNRAPSPKTVRKLAGSAEAVAARDKTEKILRAVVQAYSDHTPLALGLVVVRDVCRGGTNKQWFDSAGDDQYKIKCSLYVTAYYGADPRRMGDVLDGVMDAGDRPASQIPFDHGGYRSNLVEYYRENGPNPSGPGAPEPTQMSDPSQILSWDPVHDHNTRLLIEEPEECPYNDPPVVRCSTEPEAGTVAQIRRRYGMVFKLDLGSSDYYIVYRSGQSHTR
ncbi:hypothetical protein [Streptomyces shenzhenensis]|uniref:hypothetical protein n=1 Tax=Streptomyces shenzhenensis TaxID=943815 RepID=UPI0011C3EFAE|nr:hypothetical protein [Streptomyces shenzhenensis]